MTQPFPVVMGSPTSNVPEPSVFRVTLPEESRSMDARGTPAPECSETRPVSAVTVVSLKTQAKLYAPVPTRFPLLNSMRSEEALAKRTESGIAACPS